MGQVSENLTGLEGLPYEILIDIIQRLDVQSILSVAQVNLLFHALFTRNKPTILLPVLRREFSPFEGLLQIVTASEQDLNSRWGTYQPRTVFFKRYTDRDNSGIKLTVGGFSTTKTQCSPNLSFTQVRSTKRPTAMPPPPRAVTIWEGDIDRILTYCAVVRKWELRFPQLRWIYEPENCRSLKDHEKERFRRALYRWWLHAYYFHGDLPRPRVGMPRPFVDDARTSHMRMCSSSELLELLDLVATVKNLVGHYIIPVLEQGVAWVS
jgi:hypothetical protein